MPRVKINVGLRDKNDVQEQYVSADELSVQEVADTERGEEDMQTKENTIANGTNKQQEKQKKGGTKATHKANLGQAWSKAINQANEALNEVLDYDDVVDLGDRIADLRQASLPYAQQWLEAGKRNTFIGTAMAVNEGTMQLRETIANVRDVKTGVMWTVGRISGFFGGGA